MTKTKAIAIIALMFGAIILLSFAATIYVGSNFMPLRSAVPHITPTVLDVPSDACKDAYKQYIFEKYRSSTEPAWKPDTVCMQQVAYHSMIR